VALCAAAISAHAACTTTLGTAGQASTFSQTADITAAVAAAAPGSTICLNPGTYHPNVATYPFDGKTFGIGNAVTVLGLGASPASVILQAGGSLFAVYFDNYLGTKTVDGATLQNVTIQGAGGGPLIQNQTGNPGGRLTDITLKDLVVTTIATPAQNGVVLINADRINIDNVTVSSQFTAFLLQNVTSSLVMNSSVPITQQPGSNGIAVEGGSGNVIVNNTFGTPKTSTILANGTSYSFRNGGVVFYNTSGNRFENNVVQGFHDDGVDFTATDVISAAPPNGPGIAAAPTADNYIAKNTVISTGFADGLGAGSGIWSNCGGDNNWIYGNDVQGTPEESVVAFMTRSNIILGNAMHNNAIAGLFVSGDSNTPAFCPAASATFQNVQPVDTFIKSNYIYFNLHDGAVIRDAAATEFSSNIVSAHNGLGGAIRANGTDMLGQSMLAFQSDSRAGFASNGLQVFANASHDNVRGFDNSLGSTPGVTFAYNRLLQPDPNRYSRWNTSGSAQSWDGGAHTGGNYWTLHPVTGNPSNGGQAYGSSGAGNPALGVYDDTSTGTGLIVDHYPYQSEDLGRPGAIKVFEPLAGESVAQGTRRTVRWYAPGCMYVDVALDDGTVLATSAPNTGYAVVSIPGTASVGNHTVSVTCKTSTGAMVSSASSPLPGFTITSSTLQLLAPGRDDVVNTGSSFIVAWKQASSIASVDVDFSTNGGVSWTSLATAQTGTVARLSLPAGTSSAYGMIRVKDHANAATVDSTDGVFAIRGTSGQGFTNVSSGRVFTMGQMERLEWASPQNSRLVTITATSPSGATIATRLPDRGFYEWIVPDLGVGTLSLQITFMQSNGTVITSATSAAAGVTRDPQTVTFNSISSLGTGNSTTVTATTNSGLAATFSSGSPGVCTVSAGGTVNGVAVGTCTVLADVAGNTTFAPAMTSTLTFPVVDSTNPPRLANISTRMNVLTGNNVMIAGFIIGGSTPKTVAITAAGPSLVPFGISNPLPNPTLTLVRQSDHAVLATNNDWQSDANASLLQASGFAPTNSLEAGLYVTLAPGAYTAIVQDASGFSGVSLVGVFEVDHPEVPLINISTRGLVQTGNNVMIAGVIVQGTGPQTVVITAAGPSLVPFGISNPLPNPTLTLVRQSDHAVLATNDNWQMAPNAAQIQASGFAPTNSLEPAIMVTLDPGAYTAIVQDAAGASGVSLVGVFTTP